uniref:ATP synthase complex subunit 8 n=1 Tax=Johnius amblycephalus TaxID=912805 RepID=A0A343KQR2_9TELE|nr:ATP synthase F0 subunit 8 [Johnius amblycephalus]
MPQLDPSPWLATMLFSWLTFLTVVIPKIMVHLSPNSLASRSSEDFKTGTWNWPWL